MRAVFLTLSLGMMASAAEPNPEPKTKPWLEITLPPIGVSVAGNRPPGLDLSRLDRKYGEKGDPKSSLRAASRKALVALWASSPEPAPAVLRAEVAAVRKSIRFDAARLTTRYAIPGKAQAEARFKDEVFATSKDLARLQAHLEDVLEGLNAAESERNKECPRWQAQHDLLKLHLMLRLVVLEEHQAALGVMRKELPDFEPTKHTAWRVVSEDRLRESSGKRLRKGAGKLAEQIARAHPDTPWEKLAKHAIETPLGCRWEAVK